MSSVIAIIDSRAPLPVIENLQNQFDVFLFHSEQITYEAISCHPDIFLFQGCNRLIVAPNTPPECLSLLHDRNITFSFGKSHIGKRVDNSTSYNCIETESHFFHKQGFTDHTILNSISKLVVDLPQAYTRCSMFALNQHDFITSDKGIEKILIQQGFNCFYCKPTSILLPPYKYGFIGGCIGMVNNRLYITGSLDTLEDGKTLRNFIESRDIIIEELYNGNLYDAGGLFFL